MYSSESESRTPKLGSSYPQARGSQLIESSVDHCRILLDLTREYTRQIVNGYIDDPLLKEDINKYVTRSVYGADSGLIGALALGELALDSASISIQEPVKGTVLQN